MDADELRRRIDDLLLTHITPLVEGRQALIDAYGMREGAEILLQVALAERNFNRVWSAAADSHLPEARDSFAKALAAIRDSVAMVGNKR